MLSGVKCEKLAGFAEKYSSFTIKGLSLFLLVREADMTVAERGRMGTVKKLRYAEQISGEERIDRVV